MSDSSASVKSKYSWNFVGANVLVGVLGSCITYFVGLPAVLTGYNSEVRELQSQTAALQEDVKEIRGAVDTVGREVAEFRGQLAGIGGPSSLTEMKNKMESHASRLTAVEARPNLANAVGWDPKDPEVQKVLEVIGKGLRKQTQG